MQVKCKYCESYISDTDARCPSCGATNELLKRTANGAPKTIEDLRNWYISHNLPPEETTRFFIGKNIQERRAFGIYFDEQTQNFVVYKNKDNGQRAVRYEGKDEAYAVNELYQRLKEEIQHQKRLNADIKTGTKTPSVKVYKNAGTKLVVIFIAVIITVLASTLYIKDISTPREGYYYYQDNTYYYYQNRWYMVNNVTNNRWMYLESGKPILKTNIKKYYYERNTTKDMIPDNIDFQKSGYYFKLCDNAAYYTIDDNQIYYFYNNDWYEFLKPQNDYDYFKNKWDKIEINEYNERLNDTIRQTCYKYKKEYSNNWDIKDFRQSSYYIPEEGYYNVNGNYYYYWVNHGWYYYDTSWHYTFNRPSDDYYQHYESLYNNSNNITDFTDSYYYQDYIDSLNDDDDDDWDSGSSWDSSDSWDSGSTDWSSDW